MQAGFREIGEGPEYRMYTRAEVDALVANVQSMQLRQDDPLLKLMEGLRWIDLDKLFNGPLN